MRCCAESDSESKGGIPDYPQQDPSTPAASDVGKQNFIRCCSELLFRTDPAKDG